MSQKRKTLSEILREFLEEYPLYTEMSLNNICNIDRLKVEIIELYCRKCNKEMPFSVSRRTLQDDVSHAIIEYTALCRGCELCSCCIYVDVKDIDEVMYKIGQSSISSTYKARNLDEMLGDEQYLYRKGYECEKMGFGIGAFVYYRRIIENNINNLLEMSKQLLLLRSEDVSDIDKAISGTRMTNKIEVASKAIPGIIKMQGDNPLKIIAVALGQNIHQGSDGDCLAKAKSIRLALEYIVNNISDEIRRREEYIKSIKEIKNNSIK
ncbi:MAG TPA: hypothetical protein VMW91_10085 [Desulfosporosinus sp.]|nr:hypothetical protein [Desulfosporosinus sp.]